MELQVTRLLATPLVAMAISWSVLLVLAGLSLVRRAPTRSDRATAPDWLGENALTAAFTAFLLLGLPLAAAGALAGLAGWGWVLPLAFGAGGFAGAAHAAWSGRGLADVARALAPLEM